MNAVTTYEDCERKAEELGIPVGEITSAFGIEDPVTIKLETALDNATTQQQRREVESESLSRVDVKNKALEAILDNIPTQDERWSFLYTFIHGSKIHERILEVILDNATIQKERRRVADKALPDGRVRKAAICALCLNHT